ncbi:MAG TPA: YciI family protein [Bryobacteraceae bacterium]|nr:YciI family protein [Bryobacteraceae bacterium]
MTFAVVLEYDPADPKIDEFRPLHRAYLMGLRDEGKLVLSGPFAGNTGGMIVYDVPAREEVEAIVAGDPFTRHGVIKSHAIHQWTIAVNTTKV